MTFFVASLIVGVTIFLVCLAVIAGIGVSLEVRTRRTRQ